MLGGLRNKTCPAPVSSVEAEPLSIGITLHNLLVYIAIPCVVLTAVISLFLIFKHLHRYTRPSEQRQIVRMVFTPVVFGVFALLALNFYDAHEYLMPLPDLYEAYALACLFVLFVHYTRDPTLQDAWGPKRTNTRNEFDGVAPNLKKTWIMVFQYPIVKTILTIAQLASTATGTYCVASNSVHFGHIWIVVIGSASLVVCFMTILRFYKENKALMTIHKPMLKLLSFKLVVFVIFVESLIFNFIPTPTGLSSNGTVSPRDIKYGIPSFLVCFEMIFFSLLFHFTFRSRMYHPSQRGGSSSMTVLAAAWDAANPSDLIRDIAEMFSSDKSSRYEPARGSSPMFDQRSPSAHPLVQPTGPPRTMSPLNMPSTYGSPTGQPENPAGYGQHLGVDTSYSPHRG
ncbi:putative duf300-domain-containing protein [Neofusicoccum parvum UCRNP2]|uniref:Putative duf300-domain-containing protein n=1 Tax=Botryosphaeria parva (strain UCR-NP2) TaxID=1287680 RepID=R1H274_BOTPV|nr:putative duf300-domain-containing protein [Neofusicoccum parvum UCRNP2]